MQTQDIKYITMKKTIETKKIQRMHSELHMIDAANKVQNSHILFTDDGEEDIDVAERFNTHPDMLNRKVNRPKVKDLEQLSISDANLKVRINIIMSNAVPEICCGFQA